MRTIPLCCTGNYNEKSPSIEMLGLFSLGLPTVCVTYNYLLYRGKFLYNYSLSSQKLKDKYIKLFFITFCNLK